MNNSSHSKIWKSVWFFFMILMLAAWVSSCAQPESVTPVTEEPPTETLTAEPTEEPTAEATEEPTAEATEEPTTEPTQEPSRQECDGGDGNYTCQGLNGREITLEGLPDGVTPYLLSISPDFEEFLLGPDVKKSEETTCIFMLAGDLAFYNENDELITSFDPPVTIKYSFLPDVDNDAFQNCQKVAADAAGISPDEVEYVPVYYHEEEWKPFKDPTVEAENGLMTIEFTSWGDQPIGGGSKP